MESQQQQQQQEGEEEEESMKADSHLSSSPLASSHPFRQSLQHLSSQAWSSSSAEASEHAGPSNWADSPTLKRRRSESNSSSSPSSPETKRGQQKRPFLRARTQTPTQLDATNDERWAQLLSSGHHEHHQRPQIVLRHDSQSNAVYAHYDDAPFMQPHRSATALASAMEEDVDIAGASSTTFLPNTASGLCSVGSATQSSFGPVRMRETAARLYGGPADAMDEDMPTSLSPPLPPFARWGSDLSLPHSPTRRSGSFIHSHTPIRPSPLGDGGADRRRSLHDGERALSPRSPAFQGLRSPAAIPRRSLSTGWSNGSTRLGRAGSTHMLVELGSRDVSDNRVIDGDGDEVFVDYPAGMHMDTGQEDVRHAHEREHDAEGVGGERRLSMGTQGDAPLQRPPSPFLVREDAQAASREHARRGSVSLSDRPSILSHPRWKHLAPSPPLSP